MIDKIINNNIEKYSKKIDKFNLDKDLDCITIFTLNENDYNELNDELKSIGILIDEMNSGNLFYLSKSIFTKYGELFFIKVRKPDSNYSNYRISVDFYISNYEKFKKENINGVIKNYDTFELIQFKDDDSIINIINLKAKDDYKDKL